MVVLWSDYYGAALFGEEDGLACLPCQGCRLEIVATAESSHHEVNRILPGQVIRKSLRVMVSQVAQGLLSLALTRVGRLGPRRAPSPLSPRRRLRRQGAGG
jgi:hypothetical protein